MKKIFLAAILIAAISTSALADGKKSAQFLNDLKASLKNVNESSWVTKGVYQQANFLYNGKPAKAFINTESGELIGFTFKIDQDALPAGTKESLAKHYQGWEVSETIMFIQPSGNIVYFTKVAKGKKAIALKVSPKGKLSIYAAINS